MATLLKDNARKPIVTNGDGYADMRWIDNQPMFGFSTREPNGKRYTLFLTADEMLRTMAKWQEKIAFHYTLTLKGKP